MTKRQTQDNLEVKIKILQESIRILKGSIQSNDIPLYYEESKGEYNEMLERKLKEELTLLDKLKQEHPEYFIWLKN